LNKEPERGKEEEEDSNGGEHFNVLIRGTKGSQSDFLHDRSNFPSERFWSKNGRKEKCNHLRKLSELRVSKERDVAKELVANVSERLPKGDCCCCCCCFLMGWKEQWRNLTAQGCRGALCGA